VYLLDTDILIDVQRGYSPAALIAALKFLLDSKCYGVFCTVKPREFGRQTFVPRRQTG